MKYIKFLFFVFALIFMSLILQGQHSLTHDIQILDWHGFDQEVFQFNGHKAQIVIPKKPLDGYPWIWRARFPNWHIEMDSILLERGFHIAYINSNNLYGSPMALDVWDKFYAFLTQEKEFSKEVALEGVSRGGLFIYNWAKRNPEKVCCIYAEAPVCDFKSWPFGRGKYKGSHQEDWDRLLKTYDFNSTEEALEYKDNPVDNLEKLAAAKVPILHVIGLNDQIVPPEENTFILVDRYVKLGGIATIYPNTKGRENLAGHHFVLDDPEYIVDFIIRNTPVPAQKLDSRKYHLLRGGLDNCRIRFEQEKKGRVAFLGGSITYNPGWRDSICQYLQKRFPETHFEFIAAGIPSLGSTPGAFRLERDVLSKGKIDLLFEEAAVNDRTNGITIGQIRGMEGIVRHARMTNPAVDIVIMHFVDPPKMEDYHQGSVPVVIQNHERVAENYNIPTINLAKEVTDRIDTGEFTWEDDFKNLHPSPFGQQVYFYSMKTFLESAWSNTLDSGGQVIDHFLPDKLDPLCYDKGAFIPIEQAKPGKGWRLDPKWKPRDKARTREGYVNVPMLIAEAPGSELSLRFEGRAIGIAVAAGPDAGIVEYSIDNSPWKKMDLFTRWSARLHLPKYYVLEAELQLGKHKLKVRITNEKNENSKGHACRIANFFINGN